MPCRCVDAPHFYSLLLVVFAQNLIMLVAATFSYLFAFVLCAAVFRRYVDVPKARLLLRNGFPNETTFTGMW